MQGKDWRVFCAIDLPLQVRQRIVDHSSRLAAQVPDALASWSRLDNIHLTLKFLGNVPASDVPKLSQAAAGSVNGLAPFELVIGQTGAFPQKGPPRVLWIGVEDPSGKLRMLQQRLEEDCEQHGFPKEPRAFHPHLTVARLRKPQHSRTLAAAHQSLDFEPAKVEVNELLVIRSELSPKGSNYTVISRHKLNRH